jgi:hypothetical protein
MKLLRCNVIGLLYSVISLTSNAQTNDDFLVYQQKDLLLQKCPDH